MTCERVKKLLDEYLDGTLAPERETLVEEHLEGCEACRAEYEEHEELRELLRRTSLPADPGEQYYQRVFRTVMTVLREEPQRRGIRQFVASVGAIFSLNRGAFARAASLAIVLALGVGLGALFSGKMLTGKAEKDVALTPLPLEKPNATPFVSTTFGTATPIAGAFGAKAVTEVSLEPHMVDSDADRATAIAHGVQPADVRAATPSAGPGTIAAKSAVDAETGRDRMALVASRIRNEAVLDNLQKMKIDFYRRGTAQYIPEMQKIEGVFYDIVSQDANADRRYLEALKEYQAAEIALLKSNYLDAIKGYYQVTHKLPNSLLAFLSRFQIANLQFDVLQDYDGALINYKKLTEEYPSHFISDEKKELILERAELLTKTSADNWEALRLYERALQSKPETARALYVQMINEYPQSPLVTKAVQELVKLASAHYEAAVSPEEMITTFQSLSEKYQEQGIRAMLQVGIGDVLNFQMHNYPQAMVEYNRALQLGGTSSSGAVARERIQQLYAKREWASGRPNP